jgi:hypothetical protein
VSLLCCTSISWRFFKFSKTLFDSCTPSQTNSGRKSSGKKGKKEKKEKREARREQGGSKEGARREQGGSKERAREHESREGARGEKGEERIWVRELRAKISLSRFASSPKESGIVLNLFSDKFSLFNFAI